jgi:hypothetical protein
MKKREPIPTTEDRLSRMGAMRGRLEKQLRNRGIFDPVRIKRLERLKLRLKELGLTAREYQMQLRNAKSKEERDALEAKVR